MNTQTATQTAAKTVKFNRDAVIEMAFATTDKAEQQFLSGLYEIASTHHYAQEEIDRLHGYMVSALAEIAEGRTCTYALASNAMQIEKAIEKRDQAKKTFEMVARMGGYSIEE